jgi:farnesyl diphosphate synthase
LVFATGKINNIATEKLTPIAIAIELVHTYSLVHDDLPAMDNDDIRRNQPSCHKKFNESTAILVGDCLQSMAFQIIADDQALNDHEKINIIKILANAIGVNGMVGGQYLDLNYHQTEKELIFQLKTGALFSAAITITSALANNCQIKQKLEQLATHLGICYQWQDDAIDNNCSLSLKKATEHCILTYQALATIPNNQNLKTCIDTMLKYTKQQINQALLTSFNAT